MTVTLSFQSSGAIPGDGRPTRMRGQSMTVGRGPANDLVLADPDRTLSKTHCVIEDHNGNVVVVDLSTNGTFLNYSKIPLGRTPTPLNDGDVLSIGPYEIAVQIGAGRTALDDPGPDPLDQDRVSHGSAARAPDPLALLDDSGPEGDFLDDLLGGQARGPGQLQIPDPIDALLPPLGEDDPLAPAPLEEAHDSPLLHGAAMQDTFRPAGRVGGGTLIPEDWDLDPFSEDTTPPPPAPRAAPPAEAVTPPPPPPAAPAAIPPAAPATAPAAPQVQAPAATGGPDSGRRFVESLDVDGLTVPDAELGATMDRMGRVLRSVITGIREILMTRTGIKSEFRITQTVIGAKANNPLKFSVSPEQAIEAIVRPTTRGYLSAEEAVAEALDDIKAHEVAMVTGMEAALKGVLARLDPARLTAELDDSGRRGGLFKGRKVAYWEEYERMYAQIADQAENDFHELFSREFARAYSEQLAKLK